MRESNTKRVKNYTKRKSRRAFNWYDSKNAGAHPRARSKTHANRRKWLAEQKVIYKTAGDAAYECVYVCHGSMRENFGFIAKIIYRNFAAKNCIIDKAYEYAALEREGEVRNAISAFIVWLAKTFPEGGVA